MGDPLESTVLREVIESDLETVRRWRNHPSVRTKSLNTKLINKEDHLHWYRTTPAVKKFLFEFEGKPAGVMILEPRDDYTYSWGFYLSPLAPKGIGLGTLLCSLAIDWCLDHGVRRLVGAVLKTNLRSKRIHEKFGFSIVDEFSAGKKGVLVYEISL